MKAPENAKTSTYEAYDQADLEKVFKFITERLDTRPSIPRMQEVHEATGVAMYTIQRAYGMQMEMAHNELKRRGFNHAAIEMWAEKRDETDASPDHNN